jgi:hypothetical protein
LTRIDPGVVAVVVELRGHERQPAEELEQWKTHHEERMRADAAPAAGTLAMIRTGNNSRRWSGGRWRCNVCFR